MSYKWKAGDWAQVNFICEKLTPADICNGGICAGSDDGSLISLDDCTPVIVRPKPLPKKIKRSELRAWFERQPDWLSAARGPEDEQYRVRCKASMGWYFGGTYEAAILALRKALRKAGKFTP